MYMARSVVNLPVWLVFICIVVYLKSWKSVHICKSYCKNIRGTFFIWTRCIYMYHHWKNSHWRCCLTSKGKRKSNVHLFSAIVKPLRRSGMDHTFYLQMLGSTCKHSPDCATTDCGHRHLIAAYYSFIDPKRMKSWVARVAWHATANQMRAHLVIRSWSLLNKENELRFIRLCRQQILY